MKNETLRLIVLISTIIFYILLTSAGLIIYYHYKIDRLEKENTRLKIENLKNYKSLQEYSDRDKMLTKDNEYLKVKLKKY